MINYFSVCSRISGIINDFGGLSAVIRVTRDELIIGLDDVMGVIRK